MSCGHLTGLRNLSGIYISNRNTIESLVKRHSVSQQIALRARIVLEVATGKNSQEIAKKFDISLAPVRLWQKRWLELQGISITDLSAEERLADLARPGTPARISADQLCQIVAMACEKPEASGRPISHWTAPRGWICTERC